MLKATHKAHSVRTRRSRLGYQLLGLVAIAAAPLLGVQAYLSYREAVEVFHDAGKELLVRADRTALVVEDFLVVTRDLLNGIAMRPAVRAVDPQRCDPVLADFASVHSRYANIVVVNRSGRVICSAEPPVRPVSAAGREGFERTMRENRSVLTSAFVGPITGKWVSVMTYPLHDARNELVGMVALPIDLKHLEPLVQGGDLPRDSVIAVIDSAGHVVARSYDAGRWVGKSAAKLAVVVETRGSERGYVTGRGIDGVERVYGFRSIPGFDWQIWSGTPTAVIYAAVRHNIAQSVTLSLAILLIASGLAAVLVRRVTRPMRQLAETASRVAAGADEARASLENAPAEIADVAAQFNTMLDAQAAAQKQLRESEASLAAAQERASLGSWELDLAAQRGFWSRQMFGLFDRSPALGPPTFDEFIELVHPDDRPGLLATHARASAGMEVATHDFRSNPAHGPMRYFQATLQGIADPTGRITHLAGTVLETTARSRAEEALRESQRMFATLVSNLPGAVYRCRNDPTWTADFVSDGIHALTGYPPDDFIDNAFRSFGDRIHPDDRERVWAETQKAVSQGRSYQLVYRLGTADGQLKWVSEHGRAVHDGRHQLSYLEGFLTDISARKQAEEKVERLNRVYALLSGVNALIVRVHDREELYREACRLAVDAGRFRVAWIGRVDLLEQRVHPVAWSGAERGLLRAVEPRLTLRRQPDRGYTPAGQVVAEKRPVVVNEVAHDRRLATREALLDRDIGSFAMLPLIISSEVSGVLALHAREPGFFDDEETHLLVELAGDISFALDHIDKEERINYLAYYDSLTTLANGALFRERLEQYVHAAERERHKLAVCAIDLDHFKIVNDALGRQAGDALLAQFGQRLAACVGDSAQVARLGADRFAMVLLDARDEAGVMQMLNQRMSACVGAPFRMDGTELQVAVKVGITLFPNDGGDADTLFRNAEAALKKAKTGGDRYLFYTQQMTDRVAERLALENKLRRALDNEAFTLHYQPRVDAHTGRIAGVEALLRWTDPEDGLVLPMNFVPLLEETGIILDVGAWVITRAVQDYDHWRANGVAAPAIAVNVSAVQLRQRDFVDIVRTALSRASRPMPVEIEITESVVMEDVERTIEQLNTVHALGVSIAIDDFGTGYSSLGYLARLPAQVLKIDLSFISRMLIEPDVLTLVSTMISLAHSLRLKVVAEGVETEAQANMLRRLGCDELQGYLISRPLPRDQMTEFLSKSTPRKRSPSRNHRPTGSKR